MGVLQAEPGSDVQDRELLHFADQGARILVFPEYFWVNGDEDREAVRRRAETRLAELTRGRDWMVVGGTTPEPVDGGWHNTCLVYQNGREIARYRKINLMRGERKAGALPGRALVVVELSAGQMVEDVRLGVEGRCTVFFHGRTGGMVPSPGEVMDALRRAWARSVPREPAR